MARNPIGKYANFSSPLSALELYYKVASNAMITANVSQKSLLFGGVFFDSLNSGLQQSIGFKSNPFSLQFRDNVNVSFSVNLKSGVDIDVPTPQYTTNSLQCSPGGTESASYTCPNIVDTSKPMSNTANCVGIAGTIASTCPSYQLYSTCSEFMISNLADDVRVNLFLPFFAFLTIF